MEELLALVDQGWFGPDAKNDRCRRGADRRLSRIENVEVAEQIFNLPTRTASPVGWADSRRGG